MRQDSNVLTEGKNKAMTEYSAQKKHPLKVCPIRELSERIWSPGKRLSYPVDTDDQIKGRIQN